MGDRIVNDYQMALFFYSVFLGNKQMNHTAGDHVIQIFFAWNFFVAPASPVAPQIEEKKIYFAALFSLDDIYVFVSYLVPQ